MFLILSLLSLQTLKLDLYFFDTVPGLSFSENKCSTKSLIQLSKEQLHAIPTSLLTATAGSTLPTIRKATLLPHWMFSQNKV